MCYNTLRMGWKGMMIMKHLGKKITVIALTAVITATTAGMTFAADVSLANVAGTQTVTENNVDLKTAKFAVTIGGKEKILSPLFDKDGKPVTNVKGEQLLGENGKSVKGDKGVELTIKDGKLVTIPQVGDKNAVAETPDASAASDQSKETASVDKNAVTPAPEATPEVKEEAQPAPDATPEVKEESQPTPDTTPEVKDETKTTPEAAPEIKDETQPTPDTTSEVKDETQSASDEKTTGDESGNTADEKKNIDTDSNAGSGNSKDTNQEETGKDADGSSPENAVPENQGDSLASNEQAVNLVALDMAGVPAKIVLAGERQIVLETLDANETEVALADEPQDLSEKESSETEKSDDALEVATAGTLLEEQKTYSPGATEIVGNISSKTSGTSSVEVASSGNSSGTTSSNKVTSSTSGSKSSGSQTAKSSGSKSGIKAQSTSPKTGDTSPIILFITIAVAAAVVIIAVAVTNIRRKINNKRLSGKKSEEDGEQR